MLFIDLLYSETQFGKFVKFDCLRICYIYVHMPGMIWIALQPCKLTINVITVTWKLIAFKTSCNMNLLTVFIYHTSPQISPWT